MSEKRIMFKSTDFSILKALGILSLLGFIWGSGYSIARYAMTHGVPPLGYSFWQSLGPAILLILLSIKQKKTKEFFQPRFFPYFLVCGLLGIAIPNSNMYFTAAHLPAGLLALLVNTVPLFVYPLAYFFKQEPLSLSRLSGVFLGFLGIVILILPSHSLAQLPEIAQMTSWAWLTLLSPLCFALCSVYISHTRASSINVYVSSVGMLVTSTLFLIPFIIFSNEFYSLFPPFDGPKYAVLLEIVLSSLGYLLFFYLIQYAGSVYYSLTGGIVGLTGVFWGYVLFDEKLDPGKVIAIIMILIAIILTSYNHSQRKT